jgi:hypothetical protein
MKAQEHLPDVGVAIRERRTDQVFRRATQRFLNLKQVIAKRNSLGIGFCQSEVVLREYPQCFFGVSKKSATFPMATVI